MTRTNREVYTIFCPSVFCLMFSSQQKADSTLRSSQAVPHPSTSRALSRLTSEVERDPVHSTWYGRQRESMIIHSYRNMTSRKLGSDALTSKQAYSKQSATLASTSTTQAFKDPLRATIQRQRPQRIKPTQFGSKSSKQACKARRSLIKARSPVLA